MSLAPGQVIKATVFATPHFGVYLRHGETQILCHAADQPWGEALSPDEVAKPGDVLEVEILRVADGGRAVAGLLRPSPAQ